MHVVNTSGHWQQYAAAPRIARTQVRGRGENLTAGRWDTHAAGWSGKICTNLCALQCSDPNGASAVNSYIKSHCHFKSQTCARNRKAELWIALEFSMVQFGPVRDDHDDEQ